MPGDQAEIVFGDAFVEYLDRLPQRDREAVLSEVVALCWRPGGDHPLGNRAGSPLAGWRTLEVLERRHRIVFSSRVVDGVGVIHVLCAGPRRASAVYDAAAALVASGRLSDEEATQIWDAIILLELVAETLGLDGWDYLPPPASSRPPSRGCSASASSERRCARAGARMVPIRTVRLPRRSGRPAAASIRSTSPRCWSIANASGAGSSCRVLGPAASADAVTPARIAPAPDRAQPVAGAE